MMAYTSGMAIRAKASGFVTNRLIRPMYHFSQHKLKHPLQQAAENALACWFKKHINSPYQVLIQIREKSYNVSLI
jgi:hypothetical protein